MFYLDKVKGFVGLVPNNRMLDDVSKLFYDIKRQEIRKLKDTKTVSEDSFGEVTKLNEY